MFRITQTIGARLYIKEIAATETTVKVAYTIWMETNGITMYRK